MLVASSGILISCGEQAVDQTPITTVKKNPALTGAVITTDAPATSPTPTTVSGTTKTKIVSYATPDGEATVTFTVTLKDSIIASAASTATDLDRESREWQGKFARNVSKVVGKKISEIDSLDAIGGASLTTEAFKKFVKSL